MSNKTGIQFAKAPHDHLTVETAELLNGSLAQKIAHIKSDFYVGWPQADAALKMLQDAMDAPDSTRPRGVAILAGSGMGKSHLWKEFFRRNGIDPRTFMRINGGQPVLYVTLAAATSLKAVLLRIMEALNMPLPKKVDVDKAMLDILRAYKLSNFAIFLIDEAQDALKAPAHDVERLSLFLKLISNEGKRAIAIAGTHDAKPLITGHDQLRARMDVLTFNPWADVDDARAFIWILLSRIPLPEPSPITDDTSISKILNWAKGNTEIMAIAIRRSGEKAMVSGLTKMDLALVQANGF